MKAQDLVKRALGSRLLKWAVVVAAIGIGAYEIHKEWRQVHQALGTIGLVTCLWALLALLGMQFATLRVWQTAAHRARLAAAPAGGRPDPVHRAARQVHPRVGVADPRADGTRRAGQGAARQVGERLGPRDAALAGDRPDRRHGDAAVRAERHAVPVGVPRPPRGPRLPAPAGAQPAARQAVQAGQAPRTRPAADRPGARPRARLGVRRVGVQRPADLPDGGEVRRARRQDDPGLPWAGTRSPGASAS